MYVVYPRPTSSVISQDLATNAKRESTSLPLAKLAVTYWFYFHNLSNSQTLAPLTFLSTGGSSLNRMIRYS